AAEARAAAEHAARKRIEAEAQAAAERGASEANATASVPGELLPPLPTHAPANDNVLPSDPIAGILEGDGVAEAEEAAAPPTRKRRRAKRRSRRDDRKRNYGIFGGMFGGR
ncbi:MAG: hypothetical protein WBQ77_04685, partial [Methyloceanibacter sp.]|uniref:hypothetical protein n=1 Tax=Methyloceanibacter sp. TaxID=1965321 RepID=UPI003C3CE7ED